MRKLFGFLITGLVLATFAGCPPPITKVHTFTSADVSMRFGGVDAPTANGSGGATDEAEGGGSPAPRTVTEPDVIRQIGDTLYILNQYRGLIAVDLATNAVLSTAPTYGYPRDLYIVGDRAYVLVGYAGQTRTEGDIVSIDVSSRLYVLDVANPAAPSVLNHFDLTGDLVDSRLVGDVLYAVSAQYTWTVIPGGNGGGDGGVGTSPGGTGSGGGGDGTVVDVPPASGAPIGLKATVRKDQTSASWVTSVAVGDPAQIAVVDTKSLAGYGNIIQATSNAIYVAASDWNTNTASITYVDISDAAGAIAVRGAITVQGQVSDRFKLDEYDGVLRVVSNTWWPQRDVFVTTVDLADPDHLAVLGAITIPDASGEALFATRFDGPRAYVVTYFMVDPLFVLDLSNPADPKVAGNLVVPGWSTHIEPMGDRLLALGVDDTGGERRVSMSLFDVSDPAAPALASRVSFGESWAWSSAFSDVKALTVLDDLVLVPFAGWSGEAGGYNRLQLVSYTRDTLTLNGHVDVHGDIVRALEHGARHYGVTSEELAVFDATDRNHPVVTGTVALAENITDYQEISPAVGAAVVSRYNEGDTVVKTVDAAGATLGSVAVAAQNVSDTFVHGDDLVLISTEWDESTAFYVVHTVDCSDPAHPALANSLKVDIQPYWGYWWWYAVDGPMEAARDAAGGAAPGVADMAMYWPGPWWWMPGGSAFVLGDTLALRGTRASYDVTVGGADAQQGLALVDLASNAVTKTVGLGIPSIQSFDQSGAKLYITSIEDRGADTLGRGVAAYFIRSFDPASMSLGPAANVPGTFLQYDAASGVLVTQDYQYLEGWNVARNLTSVTWDGGETATLIDRFELPANSGTLLGRGARIAYQGWDYNSGVSQIGSVRVAGDGQLSAGHTFSVTGANTWASLIDVKNDWAFVGVSGYDVAIYDLADGNLLRLDPVMSSPWRIRFGSSAAYGPLGYAGLLKIPYPAS